MSAFGNGLQKVELSAIAGDGGVGVAFTQLGNTLQDSASLTSAQGQTTDFNIEESDAPVLSITKTGTLTLKWSCVDVSADTLVALFGGTKTGAGTVASPYIYTPPAAIVAIEKSVKLTDLQGNILTIVRASIYPAFNWGFSKTKIAQIDITAAILTPTKANTKPFTITYPGVG
jgi:hypothetical protein